MEIQSLKTKKNDLEIKYEKCKNEKSKIENELENESVCKTSLSEIKQLINEILPNN